MAKSINSTVPIKPSWGAVWAMAFAVAGLIVAEFLPPSLLTPIALDFQVSEGTAGLTVTVTSVFAVIASLFTPYFTRYLNRKTVLVSLSFLLFVSSLIVGLAPNFTVALIGRVLLGIALGGVWAMAAAIAARIVPPKSVGKALSIIFGGSSLASVFAAPLGSFLGNLIGWRNVFFAASGIGLIAFAILILVLPSLEPKTNANSNAFASVMRAPQFMIGMIAVVFAFAGWFAMFTFLRPFLEQTTGLQGNAVSTALLAFGVSNFVGTSLTGKFLKVGSRRLLIALPLSAAIVGFAFLFFGTSTALVMTLIAVWGVLTGPLPVVWTDWVTAKAPENAETANGFLVASIQTSAAAGTFVGGKIFDGFGSNGLFIMTIAFYVISGAIVFALIDRKQSEVTFPANSIGSATSEF
jgi:DHA1 family purine ribonucleoside efflux pump-like MFS transporter